jgi:pimeloyl-ACP methyl ester carboxylesterase
MESLPASVTPELAASLLRDEAGGLVVDPAQREQVFYHDCEPQLARWAAAQLGPEHPAAMTTRLTRAAWRSIASTYVVCLADRTIPAAAQEELARRCTHVERFDTSHSPMLSRPELLVELLARLAR